MKQSTGAISLDSKLRILSGTKFGTDAFAGLRFLCNFSMRGTVKLISDIE